MTDRHVLSGPPEGRAPAGPHRLRRYAAPVALAAALLATAPTATAATGGAPAPAATAHEAPRTAGTAALPGTAGPTGTSDGLQTMGGLEVKVVEPYEPAEIAPDLLMGLLPEGRQNFVVSHPDTYTESIEYAKGMAGDSIRPDSISLHVSSEDGRVELISGAWRLDETPREIVVEIAENVGYLAQLVKLPGNPGWGAFYLDTREIEGMGDEFTVTAHDADGAVFDEIDFAPFVPPQR